MAKPILSLRNRVVLTAVLSTVGAGALVTTLIALAIGPVMQQSLVQQMRLQANRAISLDRVESLDSIAEDVAQPGTSVIFSKIPSPTGPVGRLTQSVEGNTISIETVLPKSRQILTITGSAALAGQALSQILLIGIPTILVVTAVLTLALRLAMRRALKPLDDLNSLATEIAVGRRKARLTDLGDFTELGRTGRAFNAMLDALEGSIDLAKATESSMKQLTEDVTHEVRSPISSMVAGADNIIRARGISKTVEASALMIVREGQRAARLIGDLTLATQFGGDPEVASQRLECVNVLPNDLVRDAVEILMQKSKHRVSLHLSEVARREHSIFVDPQRINQVFSNLFTNAERFATSEIRFECSIDLQLGVFSIVVSDDGPGIHASDRERVFERFVRLDLDRSRSSGGSGLGLAISKALVLAHRGSLTCVEPTSLSGASFRINIPIST